MYAHATLYLTRPLDVDAAREVLRGAAEVAPLAGGFAELRGPGAVARLSVMPAGEVGVHLDGLRGYVRARCQVMSPGFAGKVDATRQVLGVVAEPGFRHGDAVWRWLAILARAGAGMVFLAGGFLDDRSRPLAAPPGLQLATTRAGSDAGGDGARPAPDRVLRRAWALAAVALRGFIDTGGRHDAAGELQRLRAWIDLSGTRTELEPAERVLIDAPLGTLDRDQVADATWQCEGALVLAWALGRCDLPGHDEEADSVAVLQALGVELDGGWTPPPPPVLRPPAELDRVARRLLGVHWRLRQLRHEPGPVDFVKFSQDSWFGGFDVFGIAIAERDLAIDGAPITRADDARVAIAASIALERHRAINWLGGDDPVYSAVDTST